MPYKKKYPMPKWAVTLTQKVCREEGIRIPTITWMKQPSRVESRGTAWPYHIDLTAGTSRAGAKIVLLHELTHSVMGQKGRSNSNHNEQFYAKFYAIGKRHGVGAKAIQKRDGWYKPRGVKAGYRLYLKRLREANRKDPAFYFGNGLTAPQ